MNIITKFPLGQYVDGNQSWLKIIDCRLKLIILSLFLISPIWSGPVWRSSLVIFLLLITFVSLLPSRVWIRTMCYLIILSIFIGIITIIATSNFANLETTTRDPNELSIIIDQKLSWNVFEFPLTKVGIINIGPYSLSKRAFVLGIKTSTLVFTVVHSVNLLLLTTLKEEIVWTFSWFLNPLRRFGMPIDKWLFQLLLALRFIPLVQEEFQNIIKSVSVRSINYRNLGLKNSFKVLVSIIERIFLNIFLRIDQGADSILSKGTLEIKTKRFIPLEERNWITFFINSISIIFIFVAIFLRKQYGAL
tara:strand:- start:3797 stop:4711 length:915 start_codon:yes stop_codon:yes gene_type:complete